jgi:anti-sigma regulatory factor (Ser/Thr protein kinase)
MRLRSGLGARSGVSAVRRGFRLGGVTGSTGALVALRSVWSSTQAPPGCEDTAAPAVRALVVSMPAVFDSIPALRSMVTAVAIRQGAPVETVQSVSLVVSEAVANASRHAYPGTRGDVVVEVWALPRGLEIVIRDHGVGIQMDRLLPNRRRVGLALMASLSAGCRVEATPPGTTLRMRFTV